MFCLRSYDQHVAEQRPRTGAPVAAFATVAMPFSYYNTYNLCRIPAVTADLLDLPLNARVRAFSRLDTRVAVRAVSRAATAASHQPLAILQQMPLHFC